MEGYGVRTGPAIGALVAELGELLNLYPHELTVTSRRARA